MAPLLAVLGLLASSAYVGYRVPPSDEGAVLTQAAKILRGGVFYRDIDAYPFPAAAYLVAGAMASFGEHVAVARWLAAGIYCGILLALYAIAVQLLERRRAALLGLSLLGFKFIAWPGLTAYCYWDLAFLFACLAIALLLRHLERGGAGGSPRLLAAGLCAGLSLTSKQSLGIYLTATAFLLLWLRPRAVGSEPRSARMRELAAFGVGAAAPVLLMAGYFAAQGVLPQMVESGLVRPLSSYLPTSGISGLAPLRWWELGGLQDVGSFPYWVEPYWRMLKFERLPGKSLYPLYWLGGEVFARVLYSSVLVAFAAVAVHRLRTVGGGGAPRDRGLHASAALAFAVVLSAAPRLDLPHVISVYPLVLVLLFCLWERFVRGLRLGLAAPRLETAAVLLLVFGTAILTGIHHSHLSYRLKLERADLRIDPFDAYTESVVRFISDELGSDDRLFVLGHDAHYYFLSGRFHPWRFVQLYPGQEGADGGRELVEILEREPPKLIVTGTLRIPGVPSLSDYAPQLDRWVASRYELDPRAAQRYPPPAGWPRSLVTVLRPRSSPDPLP
jgi:hypothetical protein